MPDIRIDIDEMEDVISTLNDTVDDAEQCVKIVFEYAEALENMQSKYLKNIDEIDVMMNETNQLVEAIINAKDAIIKINQYMEEQDDKGRELGD